MANPSNPAPKPCRPNQPNSSPLKRISEKLKENPQQVSWLASMGAMTVLLCSAGLITTFTWTSIQFILHPEQVSWFNKFLPGWGNIANNNLEHSQTLKEIQDSLSKQGQIAGQILPLEGDTTTSFLLPIFKQHIHCQSDCKYIVELRVYQHAANPELQSVPKGYYHLAAQLKVSGPEESFVVAPIVHATDDNQGSSSPLPLSEVRRFEGHTPSPGVWFYLRGQRQQGTSRIAYGQILYYNPDGAHLQLMLPWTSPSGQLPQWREVTGNDPKQLVVDQTVGVEPQLRVYQVNSVKFVLNPIQLEEISLTLPALQDSDYQNALALARSGLWTPAFELLQSLKKEQNGQLPEAAQAQMDLIDLHSQFTKTQADTNSASPSQQVLADLIDGRWEKALQIFEASLQNAQEIATLLKADQGRLWSRVEAQLRINPNQQSVQAWGALILAAKYGQERANSWLNGRSKTTTDSLAYIQGLLGQLNGEATSQIPIHSSQIVGSVQSIAEVNAADWLQSPSQQTRHRVFENTQHSIFVDTQQDVSLQKADNQVWYQVEVSAFHDGKRWLHFPFTNLKPPQNSPEKFFWKALGIDSDQEIQIVVWLANREPLTTTATIKAVQFRDGVLRLLVAADATVNSLYATSPHQPLLAMTNSALELVEPVPMTLQELYEQDTLGVKAMLPILWRTLQESGHLSHGEVPDSEYILQKLGRLPVQEVDLTGDVQPETVITISPEAIASLDKLPDASKDTSFPQPILISPDKNQSRPRTLILSDSGQVIYNDLKQDSSQVLRAIAKLSEGQSVGLLVENGHSYTLKVWSQKNQRFE